MPGIAGILEGGKRDEVGWMLARLKHRGRLVSETWETGKATLGLVSTVSQPASSAPSEHVAQDCSGPGRLAKAMVMRGQVILERDPLGVAPLYYGRTEQGALCFASEVKALLEVTCDVNQFPPGCQAVGNVLLRPYFRLERGKPLAGPPEQVASELRKRIEKAVRSCMTQPVMSAWLSGGLDSSAIAALARPHVQALHTVAAGLPGAPDLEHARTTAAFIKSTHHEVIVGINDILAVLATVIYHLESFDALLVRSSVMNYLAGWTAACYASDVLSGEGGDELFAGYEYLKSLPQDALVDELVDITGRLHNTALQRVDRCSAAHGLLAHVPFLDPEVVEYAMRIPVEMKLRDGVEKWILRRALDGALPTSVLERRKAKFWEGAGVGDLLARHAEEHVTEDDFKRERILPNGWKLNTKEECFYYRIFKDHFGKAATYDWMGRTKGAPTEEV